MSFPIIVLMNGTILAYAVVGGVFLAFSDFIMRALTRAGQGAATMQIINRAVFRWIFMALFLALVPVSLAWIVYGLRVESGVSGVLMACGGALYLSGCFAVTAFVNVPMNTALADFASHSAEMEHYWRGIYVPRWTAWNTVRAVACLLAAIASQAGLVAPLLRAAGS
ncbi:DUF1772 domain-containing protein [Cognatishimia sp. F0-27]|uniref:anthrone oxygenase family protein n=1 Tax=Cognatishimia sp. F0-27 TaxID=2816855 RepID=UPI001D0BF884|nr:anthrone oxygenase family protein [Cognatishimia sp. F0-27]MCC1494030.1 DUF1772 domain-containing protein [Cognatishimia sp. F0-27]